jgi:polyisoprenoid-binding protein YceI
VKQHPEIRFSLTGYELKDGAVAAAGQLSIHGQTRDVVLPGSVTAKANGVNVKGSYGLKMSDYGIKPPVMMLGTIRVADALTISYDFDLLP